jgi:MerR family Zn(II)-responsive transcriptional regulator of zntA
MTRLDRESHQFTIGALAAHAGVSKHTILYYERCGLLAEGQRTATGYRLFSMDDVSRIAFIKAAQQLGFTLNEIREIIVALRIPGATCEVMHQRVFAKIDDVDAKMRTLRAARKQLLSLVEECPGKQRFNECAIVQGLAGNDDRLSRSRRRAG